MSRLFNTYGKTQTAVASNSPAYLALLEEVPLLAKCFIGQSSEDGKTTLPPCSLILFLERDLLKFCLSPKVGDEVAFGVVQEPLYSLEGVERALREDKFEWKKGHNRK